jgi:hypothetical protein
MATVRDTSTENKINIVTTTENNVNVTQPVTSIVTISALGPQGAQGPQGQPGEIPSTGSFVLTSSFNSFTSSYYVDSSSFSTRIINLENFSSSLDATFATDAELNAATASLSASISYLSSSFETFSGSYNTGSFTGSFTGDGSQLTGIVSSKWTGSNPITREGNVEITGSLIISGSSTFINIGPAIFSGSVTSVSGFTGSLLGTASFATSASQAVSSSFTITASFAQTSQTASYVLQAVSASFATSASFAVSASRAVTASYALTASYTLGLDTGSLVTTASFNAFTASYTTGSFSGSFVGDGSQLSGISSTPFPFIGDAVITGSLVVSASATSQSLSVIGSGSTVFDIIGSVGTLFSVDDDLTGTLFSVNDISGFPVLQADATGEVYIGKSPQSLYTTAVISSTTAATTHSLISLSTSSYDGAFFEYTAISSSNARAGSIMSVWNGANIVSTETTSSQIGSTTDLTAEVIISQSQAQFVVYGANASYKVKTIIKAI